MDARKIAVFAALALGVVLLLVLSRGLWRGDREPVHLDHDNHRHETEMEERDHHRHPHMNGEESISHNHGEQGEHEDQDKNEEHGDHGDHVVRLTKAELEESGIDIAAAAPRNLDIYIDLPGEIVFNADRLAHIVPRVSGIARNVYKGLGDNVRTREVMAVMDSRELADATAEYLAAREREKIARSIFEREERLWDKKITSEQEYLNSKKSLAEARIALRSAQQKLLALGFTKTHLDRLPDRLDADYTRYEIIAPFDGTVIDKHITLGEALKEDTEVFVLADLSTVWVDINVFQKDLAAIRKGQKVLIQIGHGIPDEEGIIDFVGPIIGEQTRTALARVILPNPEGLLRPGTYLTARVAVESAHVTVTVPKTALQVIDGEMVVFLALEDGFEAHPVKTGRQSDTEVEIVSGLEPGVRYVVKGSFHLKAKLITETMDSHAGHGH